MSAFQKRAWRFNLLLAAVVWAGWLLFGGQFALHSIVKNWQVALTMIFGSLVGGGTSEGGGAVAFPVFTKVLHIPAAEARVFAFAIQSIGMTAASISILYLKIPIEKRVLAWAGGAGILGLLLSTFFIVPHVPAPLVKISFTVMVSSLAVALLVMNRREGNYRNLLCPVWGAREKLLIVAAGLIGGLMSGLVGCGENIVTFMVMVLLFRVSEKVVTPTTVILMTMVTLVGFALHAFVVKDFPPKVEGYWLAAVPIVCVGAPLGALICSMLTRRTIANILIGLITMEFVSTIVLIPMSCAVALTAGGTLVISGLLNWWMSRVQLYRPKDEPKQRTKDQVGSAWASGSAS
ncbi:sulfite exporter TauE/SafE family protein [Silvibacterium sp.]|uniref:sulfite exporter TauE/SafE family protein n=1 Tax=Silvibacterium sp. TaxID=1964179 RepID=UPI0039E458BE